MHNSRFSLVCLLALLPMGCANWNAVKPDDSNSAALSASQTETSPMQLMAIDFVNALQQIRELVPSATTVQLLRADRSDLFTASMQTALEDAGYGIRWVEDDGGNYLMQYRQVREATSGATHRDIYEVAVGQVEMRRTYVLGTEVGVKPVTPLYVRGTDASNIVLNDSVFEPVEVSQQPQNAPAAVVIPVPPKAIAPKLQTTEPVATVSPVELGIDNQSRLAVPDEANPLQGLVSDATSTKSLTLPLVALPRVENVFELGGSNFEDILAGHVKVEEQILTFPNDSLRLGDLNKRFIERMVVRFDAQSDVFSLIGCSLGPTNIEGGNAALALGRASRVREALLFAGVPQNKILDEGCWAGDSADNTLPRRGVVVTLNRRS
ncbi:MAG: hypothetical protein AB8B79_06755 [Granulosicoccus sp.]